MVAEKKWKNYEEVAIYLLDQFAKDFGLDRVEGKQKVTGRNSGWEIDARGVSEKNNIFLVVECRRYTKSRQSQEQIGALAYRIKDIGATGGIVVSPLGLQAGAAKIAKAENIRNIVLNPNSTKTDYFLSYLNKFFVGISEKVTVTDKVEIEVYNRNGELIDKRES